MDWSSVSEGQQEKEQEEEQRKARESKDESELVVCVDLKCEVENKFIYSTKQYREHNGHKIEEFGRMKGKILREASEPGFLYKQLERELEEAKEAVARLQEERNALKIGLEEKQKTVYALEHCGLEWVLGDRELQGRIIRLFTSQREYYYFSKDALAGLDDALARLGRVQANLRMKYWWSPVDKHPDVTLEGMIAHTDSQGYRYAYIEPCLQRGKSFTVNLRVKAGNVTILP